VLRGRPHLSCLVRHPETRVTRLSRNTRALGVSAQSLPSAKRRRRDVPARPFQVRRNEPRLPSFASSAVLTCRRSIRVSPRCPDPQSDMRNFARKGSRRGRQAITQYCFNNDAYYAFRRQLRAWAGDVPIIAGVDAHHRHERSHVFARRSRADSSAGFASGWSRSKRPRLRRRDFASNRHPAAERKKISCPGAPGIHFYTLARLRPRSASEDRAFFRCGRRSRRRKSGAVVLPSRRASVIMAARGALSGTGGSPSGGR